MFHVEQIELLKRALEQSEIDIYPGLIELFSEYRKKLLLWNRKINLISRRDEERIVERHFLESAGLVETVSFPPESLVIDLGSGAGFPGIPIKLVRPDLKMVLVESKRKKVLFLRHVIEKLSLHGIDVVQGRIEEMEGRIVPADFVVSRSVADISTLVKWCRNYLKTPGGKLIAIKGPNVLKELDRLKKETSLPGMELKKVQLVKYDPFPALSQHRESFLVLMEKP